MSVAYTTKEHSSAHAYKRAKERLKLPDTISFQRFVDCLLRKIREGDARFVKLGRDGRLFYEVCEIDAYPGVVRVLVNAEKTFVISVLFDAEAKANYRAKRKRKRELLRKLSGERR
jgi:hypothetical protein